mmetsp:Transcript_18908/g.23228  ORF Transcript_18908/g.23228 Transcript_18908/m.23228 type:complete len:692 (-) Transcript_18908:128-2203(-)
MTEEHPSSITLPQILTRNTILPSLSALDAGDVIECYALIRRAKLENVENSENRLRHASSENLSNNINPANMYLEVTKSAIAFRYKPNSLSAVSKAPFELTLEYGPQRTGSTQSLEAMPSVNGHRRDLDPSLGQFKEEYVSWENHAKIYYTLSIPDQEWENAYYMAPITGAVLSNILNDYIIEYPIRHPRYQPFTVVEKGTSRTILRSSNSEDFVWNVFQNLADMFVNIQPLLAPRRIGLQIYVEDFNRDVEKLDSSLLVDNEEYTMNVANAAAKFYNSLYACVGAIKYGDYSQFEKTNAPSFVPSASPTSSTPTISPTAAATDDTTSSPTDKVTSLSTGNTKGNSKSHGSNSVHTKHNSKNHGSNNTTKNEEDDGYEGDDGYEVYDDYEGDDDKEVDDDEEDKEDVDNEELTRKLGTWERSLNETVFINDEIETDFAENAEQAAEEAMAAAEVAKEAAESSKDNKTAAAAEQAAEAAAKAAQFTSDAAAVAAMEEIFSGDGSSMTSVISTCFSDPKYRIRSDEKIILRKSEDGETMTAQNVPTTHAYLYVDGSHYYRLNLTSPYMTAQEMVNPLPKPSIVPEGKGDFVDITLAIAIIVCFWFGILVMLHHVRVINWDSRLQFNWFFHPTKFKGDHKRGDYSSTSVSMTESMDEDVDDEAGFARSTSYANGNNSLYTQEHHGIELMTTDSST